MTSIYEYQPGMEQTDPSVREEVLAAWAAYDPSAYTEADVRRALQNPRLRRRDLAALLSPAALPLLEEIAQRAKGERERHFGKNVQLFTPLYISNYCENGCVYCGFGCHSRIHRRRLNEAEIEAEMAAIAATGMREVLLLTGESRQKSGIDYLECAVGIAKKYFSTIGLEVYPMNTADYARLHAAGADFVTVFQETYDAQRYDVLHPVGHKRCFPYRIEAQERAILGGMRGAGFGVLLGLADFRRDMYACAVHAALIQRKYPHAEIALSFPRLRPAAAEQKLDVHEVDERALLQMMLVCRLWLPYASFTISTRERAVFRDHVLGLAATKISAGVSTGIGEHSEQTGETGDAQFEIADSRTLAQVHAAIAAQGLQPVYTDYI